MVFNILAPRAWTSDFFRWPPSKIPMPTVNIHRLSAMVCRLYGGLRLLDHRGASMKSKPVIPESHVEQEGVARRVPLDPPAIDSRAAANDDLARLEKDEKGPNPLWVI